jgi:hypothetical protein
MNNLSLTQYLISTFDSNVSGFDFTTDLTSSISDITVDITILNTNLDFAFQTFDIS